MRCPQCKRLYLTAGGYAKHRRREIADWLDQCGETERAARTRIAALQRFMPGTEVWQFNSQGKWHLQIEDQVWPIK